MMLVIAVGLIDRWAGLDDRPRATRPYDSELIVNIALVILVAGVTIVFGLVAAVITGLILSMGLFLAVMNRSLIRSVQTAATRGSRRVYPPEQASLLRVEGHRIKLLELDGAIFFGTADRLGFEALRAAHGAQIPHHRPAPRHDDRRVGRADAREAVASPRASRTSPAARAHLRDEQAGTRADRRGRVHAASSHRLVRRRGPRARVRGASPARRRARPRDRKRNWRSASSRS